MTSMGFILISSNLLNYAPLTPSLQRMCTQTHTNLGLVKSVARCSMTDDRMQHVVLVNIEQERAGWTEQTSQED